MWIYRTEGTNAMAEVTAIDKQEIVRKARPAGECATTVIPEGVKKDGH
jgi:hypothetical protein